jgi:DNA-binding transcriptional LysR family regulator
LRCATRSAFVPNFGSSTIAFNPATERNLRQRLWFATPISDRAIGSPLRRKTGYVLTSAGHHVTETAERIESSIIADQSAIGVPKSTLSGMERIGAPDGFGSYFLAPRLVEISERHPELDIQLVATARLFSLSKREADIAISLSVPKEGRIVGRKLTDYTLGLYSTAAYLERFPEIERREDLATHRFVVYR